MKDALVAFLLIGGSFFMFLSGLGIYRFPDVYARMHAATKAASFGIGMMLLAFTLHYFSWFTAVQAIFIILFIFVTAPIGAHMLGRAAYLLKIRLCRETMADEMKGLYDAPRERTE